MLNSIADNLDNTYSSLELLKKVVIIASNLDSSLELLIPRVTRPVGWTIPRLEHFAGSNLIAGKKKVTF